MGLFWRREAREIDENIRGQIAAIAQRLQTAAELIAQPTTEAGRELAYNSMVRATAELETIAEEGEKER